MKTDPCLKETENRYNRSRRTKVNTEQVEEWLPCPGFEGFYEVSDLGRVRRAKAGHATYAGRVLKPTPDKDGYPRLSLYTDGKQSLRHVHCLVAQAFIPNPLNLPQVNHIKGTEKWNCSVDNLEWTTQSGNTQHAYDTGLLVAASGEKHGNAKLTQQQVDEIRSRYIPGVNSVIRGNGAELAKEFGTSRTYINSVFNGQRWKHSLPPKKPVTDVAAFSNVAAGE
jgi:hypothetical protein